MVKLAVTITIAGKLYNEIENLRKKYYKGASRSYVFEMALKEGLQVLKRSEISVMKP